MTVFSRSGVSSPLGKCTEELKAKVPEDVKTDFAIATRLAEKPNPSEHLRDVVMQHLYGAVTPDLQAIVWEHVLNETKSDFLRELLRKAIFGVAHELTISDSNSGLKGMNRTPSGRRTTDAH
jgi:hypothetical protein